MHNFVVHSNESACKKSSVLGWNKSRVMSYLPGKLLTLGSLLRIPNINNNTGRHGNTIKPHGTSTISPKTVNNSTSSFLSHLLLRGSSRDTTVRAFKSRCQLFIKRYQLSARPYTWLENTVPSKLRKITTSPPQNV